MKPIGYWLSRTDKALTARMNAALADFGLTRLAWQVLNVVADDPEATDASVMGFLAANATPDALADAIGTVVGDGWAVRSRPGRLALTEDGRTRLTEVAARVDAFRALSAHGISDEEYRTAVDVLERMALNLEAPTPPARAIASGESPARPSHSSE
ncbi:MarR family winged helix-turn-helix transcriptional regulator [Streptomyces sp. NPDC059072]|uniref:MarR family winged helix-turn-helix transcriptional regulator n=1 Tax=unclassified Streptomyces TaxID=2593676 RepID=UPI0036B53273